MRKQKLRFERSLIAPGALEAAAVGAKSRRDWEARSAAALKWASAFDKTAAEQTKEISLQGTFLHRVFIDVLGYLDQGGAQEGEWSLVAEPVTDVNTRRADGSLGFFRQGRAIVRAVIELKDSLTDLDAKQLSRADRLSPVEQVLLYLAQFEEARFAIVSNFRELRLYSRQYGMTRFQSFRVDELHKGDEVARLVGVCAVETLLGGHSDESPPIDQLLSTQSPRPQQEITKQFYQSYASFRDQLVHHVAHAQPELGPDAVSHTQKLLDRLLFVLYAEALGLLPAGITGSTIRQGQASRSRSSCRVWQEFRYLFADIDQGRPDFHPQINRYNGGLFAHDPVLDGLIEIPDDLLVAPLLRLATYDFQSEIDVNVLGHVFENSIADLELLKRQLTLLGSSVERELAAVDQQRRKLGIYYTPSWVTHFIVDQTLGRHLQSHPPEDRLEVAVLDPACGSGAFLSEALSYLASYSATLKTTALVGKEPLFIQDAHVSAESHLKQLYGLDLLPEAVEISRLSLWLKSAAPTRPLGQIENVVTGNTLSPSTATDGFSNTPIGAKVAAGGFEVVIANPPWGATIDYDLTPVLTLAQGQYDSYELFLELSLRTFARRGGLVGFIVPDRILRPEGERVRRWLFDGFKVLTVVKVGEGVFPGVFRAAVVVVAANVLPGPEDHYTGLIITKADREALDRSGSAQLATLLEERGGKVSRRRVVGEPSYQIDLFPDIDLEIADTMDAKSVNWIGPAGVFGVHGRGEELGRESFTVQCPGCFGWSINPRPRAKRRGGGFETKTCPHCRHKFSVSDSLRRELLVRAQYESNDPDQAPMYSGEEVNRYWLARPLGLRLKVAGLKYKPARLYAPPKVVVRQTGVGIYATLDLSDTRTSQSVYIYHLAKEERCAPEFFLAQLNSRAMLFRYFVRTSQVEWQSFPKLTQKTLQQLPLKRADLDSATELRIHDEIVGLVRDRMKYAAKEEGEPISVTALDIDEAIESLVMDLHHLTPDQRARIHKRLRPLQNIRIIRELYPPGDQLAD